MDNGTTLVANVWKCPDGTILQSKHRHDLVDYTDADGKYYMVDGGLDYIRHTGNMEPMCVFSNDEHSLKREWFMWGTRGKEGKTSIQWVKLKDLDYDRIEAILDTQAHLERHMKRMFFNELKYRSTKDLQESLEDFSTKQKAWYNTPS